MKLVYIASPYAGDVQANTEAAKSYCRAALEEGVVPIAPHLLFPQFLEDNDPAERNLGLRAGLELLARCDELWVCGPEISPGMSREIQFAQASASRSGRWNRQRPCGEDCPYDPGQPVRWDRGLPPRRQQSRDHHPLG